MMSKVLTIYLCLISILLFSMFEITRADFCHSFLTEKGPIFGYSISQENYLFIGNKYWKLKPFWLSPVPVLTTTKEQTLNVAGVSWVNKFAFSFLVCTDEDYTCQKHPEKNKRVTGIPREPTSDHDLPIDWYNLYGLDSLTIGPKQYTQYFKISVNPSLAFTYPPEITCFLEQTKSGSKFLRSFDCKKIDSLSKGFDGYYFLEAPEVLKAMEPYFRLTFHENKQTYLFYNISDTKEVVAIFFLVKNFIFIFKENKRLTFCYTNELNFVTPCLKTQTMINCEELIESCRLYCQQMPSMYSTTTSTTTTTTSRSTLLLTDRTGSVSGVYDNQNETTLSSTEAEISSGIGIGDNNVNESDSQTTSTQLISTPELNQSLTPELRPEETPEETPESTTTSDCKPTPNLINKILVISLIIVVMAILVLLVYHLIYVVPSNAKPISPKTSPKGAKSPTNASQLNSQEVGSKEKSASTRTQ